MWLDLRLQEVLYYKALLDTDVEGLIEAVCMSLFTKISSLPVQREALWRKTWASTGSHLGLRQAALRCLHTGAVVLQACWGGLAFPSDRWCRGRKGREIQGFFIWGKKQPGDNKPCKWKTCFLKQGRMSAQTGLMRQSFVKRKLPKITHILFECMHCSVLLYVSICNLCVRNYLCTIYHLCIYTIDTCLDTVVVWTSMATIRSHVWIIRLQLELFGRD